MGSVPESHHSQYRGGRGSGVDSALSWLAGRARRLGYRSYYQLVAVNYAHQWLSTENRTPAGTFRSYELLNRHGSDPMLAELDAAANSEAVIYDIGANVGVYSLALAAGEPDRRLVACEPAPRIQRQLRANIAANAVDDRIEVLDCGVGATDGSQRFYRSTYPECSGFDRESATRWGATVADTAEVAVRRLDRLVDSHGLPDAVKIDVEGAAPAVLRGARETLQTHQPTLFIEIHEEGLLTDIAGEVRELLRGVDYSIAEREGYWRCEPQA